MTGWLEDSFPSGDHPANSGYFSGNCRAHPTIEFDRDSQGQQSEHTTEYEGWEVEVLCEGVQGHSGITGVERI
jgi:hypothetical protein